MPRLTIDGRTVDAPEGATVLEAARAAGIAVPTLCHRDGLAPRASCMVCAVCDRAGGRFLPACETPAEEGMDLDASGPDVLALRRKVLGLLLEEHAGDCVAPCARVCPFGMDVPAAAAAFRRGALEDAAAIVAARIPLPAAFARTCDAPCENACRRALLEGPVSIRDLHGLAAAHAAPLATRTASGKTVAVVGAGPAGLAAASFLLRAGHGVRVLEAGDAFGGSLRSGVPRETLPLEILDGEIEALGAAGAELAAGAGVFSAADLRALRAENDAAVLAFGPTPAGTIEALGLAPGPRGIAADADGAVEGEDGLFALGGAVRPAKQAVQAAAGARRVAAAVTRFFAGGGAAAPGRFTSRLGRLSAAEAAAFTAGAVARPRSTPDPGALFTPDAARGEASRCLACGCAAAESCRLRARADALGARPAEGSSHRRRPFTAVAIHGGVRFEAGKCVLCGVCVRMAEQRGLRFGPAFSGRGRATTVAPPLGRRWDEALGGHAAEIAAACPTGALIFEAP